MTWQPAGDGYGIVNAGASRKMSANTQSFKKSTRATKKSDLASR
jgi:hypothetical protein